jgi:hypothetical protein
MMAFRRIAALSIVPLLVWGAAALAGAGPARASTAKMVCLQPIVAAYHTTTRAISSERDGAMSSESPRALTVEAASEINNALADCLLQPAGVDKNLHKAKKANAEVLKLYDQGHHDATFPIQQKVLYAMIGAEDAVR